MASKNELIKNLENIDSEFEPNNEEEINEEANNDLMLSFSRSNITQTARMAVLGLDIYKYSEFEEDKQNLIPFIFDLLFDEAIKHTIQSDVSFFQNEIDIRAKFISTGDGGFILFKTPLHALVFNLHFYSVLHLFNTGHFFPRLSKYIGNIIVRSSITFDKVYEYEKNYYGKAIINNARIISKDRLNRFIIDRNVYYYFNRNFNGIESLPIITIDRIEKVLKIKIESRTAYFYRRDDVGKNIIWIDDPIRNVHIQKVEEVISKNTKLELYNIEIQFCAKIGAGSDPTKTTSYILTVGNSNVNSIE